MFLCVNLTSGFWCYTRFIVRFVLVLCGIGTKESLNSCYIYAYARQNWFMVWWIWTAVTQTVSTVKISAFLFSENQQKYENEKEYPNPNRTNFKCTPTTELLGRLSTRCIQNSHGTKIKLKIIVFTALNRIWIGYMREKWWFVSASRASVLVNKASARETHANVIVPNVYVRMENEKV